MDFRVPPLLTIAGAALQERQGGRRGDAFAWLVVAVLRWRSTGESAVISPQRFPRSEGICGRGRLLACSSDGRSAKTVGLLVYPMAAGQQSNWRRQRHDQSKRAVPE